MNESNIIEGREIARTRGEILQEKIAKLAVKPKIVSILVGSDPASILYSKIKKNKATQLGIDFELLEFPQEVTFEKLAEVINELNHNESVNGIMVQLPLPGKFNTDELTDKVLLQIAPKKDVDGLTSLGPVPQATVKAVLTILESINIDVRGKKVGVVGVTGMVGGPLAQALSQMGAEIHGFSSKTVDLSKEASECDILICCANKPDIIGVDAVKTGAVVIDVGMNVKFDEVVGKTSLITPPVGGVGPVTVISLMENAYDLVTV